MKILDGNVLIYAINADVSQHVMCKAWLDSALAGSEVVGFNWTAINGFLRVTTHQNVFSRPLSIAEATGHIEGWLRSPIVQIVEPKTNHWDVLRDVLMRLGIGGNLTTDAHLAALARSYDATLVSCDADFARFPGLKWENPLA